MQKTLVCMLPHRWQDLLDSTWEDLIRPIVSSNSLTLLQLAQGVFLFHLETIKIFFICMGLTCFLHLMEPITLRSVFCQCFLVKIQKVWSVLFCYPFNQLLQVQNSGHHGIGLRPLGLPISSGMGDYEQILQQYQQQQNQSQLRLQQMSAASQSYRDKGLKSTQGAQANFDRFGLLGLTSVMSMSDPDLSSLALGIDLTTLGLNLSSNNSLYKAFASPFYDESTKGEPEYSIPNCYYSKQPPALMVSYLAAILIFLVTKFGQYLSQVLFHGCSKDILQGFSCAHCFTSFTGMFL